MTKVHPKEPASRISRQKKTHNYIRPGTLAQLRHTTRSSEIMKKMLSSAKSKKADERVGKSTTKVESPFMLSPVCMKKQRHLLNSSRIPGAKKPNSRLESLPVDLLVKIICHLHHDQLKAAFHVSTTVRKAVLSARKIHFNYTTPDRSRQEMLRTITPTSTDRWPFVSNEHGRNQLMRVPHTPKAPRHGPRPPSRLMLTDVRQVTTVLFPEPSRWVVPVLPRPLFRPFPSNRALLYEDELCEAVAQNRFL